MKTKNPPSSGGEKKLNVCENFRAILADMSSEKQWYVARARCKQWDCEHCARINQTRWRAHIIDKINKIGTPDSWIFMTITAHRKAHKALAQSATLTNLQRGLKTLYDRLRRVVVKSTPKMEYVRVYEQHKSGKIHAHIIVRAMFTVQTGKYDKHGNDRGLTRWLKDNCSQVGLGYQASAKPITSAKGVHAGTIAAYVTKYMTKSLQGFQNFPSGIRRVQCSSGFGALKEHESVYDWQVKSGIYRTEVLGRIVTDVNLDKQITLDDFEGSYIYPVNMRDD